MSRFLSPSSRGSPDGGKSEPSKLSPPPPPAHKEKPRGRPGAEEPLSCEQPWSSQRERYANVANYRSNAAELHHSTRFSEPASLLRGVVPPFDTFGASGSLSLSLSLGFFSPLPFAQISDTSRSVSAPARIILLPRPRAAPATTTKPSLSPGSEVPTDKSPELRPIAPRLTAKKRELR